MGEEHRIRTERYTLTMLPEEAAHLETGALELGISKAEYLRNLIVWGGLYNSRQTMDKEQAKQLIYEINRIGNNVNQVAFNTNSKSFAGHPEWMQLKKDFLELLALLAEVPFVSGEEEEEWRQRASMLLHRQ